MNKYFDRLSGKNAISKVVGIEDSVISEIDRMPDNDRYIERFKDYLKDALISLERENSTAYPALSKKLSSIEKEIESLIDELLKVKSDALRERLQKEEKERAVLKKELRKYENVKKQPSKVLLLVNEYSKALNNVGMILKRLRASKKLQ